MNSAERERANSAHREKTRPASGTVDAWGPALRELADDLQPSVVPWLEQLLRALGPPRKPRPRPEGEPDGSSGLARRGPYERLLISEWLLAEELPDEFLRRAATGEHLFVELARRDDVAGAGCLVVFDSGPAQLGAPRLAHVALLIALGRRATLGRMPFRWTTLAQLAHVAASELPSDAGPTGVKALLAQRAPTSDPTALAPFLATFANEKTPLDELWLVGAPPGHWLAPSAASALPRPSCISIEEPVALGERALALTIDDRRGRKSLRLTLPDDALAIRLLRDPYPPKPVAAPPPKPQTKPAPASDRIVSSPVFAVNGAKLLAKLADGRVLALPVPNSARAVVGQAKLYAPRRGDVYAAAWTRRMLVTLSVDVERQEFHLWSPRGHQLLEGWDQRSVPLPSDWIGSPGSRLQQLHALELPNHTRLFVLDGADQLFALGAERHLVEGSTNVNWCARWVGNAGSSLVSSVDAVHAAYWPVLDQGLVGPLPPGVNGRTVFETQQRLRPGTSLVLPMVDRLTARRVLGGAHGTTIVLSQHPTGYDTTYAPLQATLAELHAADVICGTFANGGKPGLVVLRERALELRAAGAAPRLVELPTRAVEATVSADGLRAAVVLVDERVLFVELPSGVLLGAAPWPRSVGK